MRPWSRLVQNGLLKLPFCGRYWIPGVRFGSITENAIFNLKLQNLNLKTWKLSVKMQKLYIDLQAKITATFMTITKIDSIRNIPTLIFRCRNPSHQNYTSSKHKLKEQKPKRSDMLDMLLTWVLSFLDQRWLLWRFDSERYRGNFGWPQGRKAASPRAKKWPVRCWTIYRSHITDRYAPWARPRRQSRFVNVLLDTLKRCNFILNFFCALRSS